MHCCNNWSQLDAYTYHICMHQIRQWRILFSQPFVNYLSVLNKELVHRKIQLLLEVLSLKHKKKKKINKMRGEKKTKKEYIVVFIRKNIKCAFIALLP